MISSLVANARTARFGVAHRLKVAAGALALALGIGLSGVPSTSRADVPSIQAPVCAGSVTHGHVFLYASAGPVDVTSMITVIDSQTYVAANNQYMAIGINSVTGNVYDITGANIGFVAVLTD